jgi:hypothetical protein
MRSIALLASALFLASAFIVISTAPANAGTMTGWVTHVSSTNIKTKDSSGHETSFALAPSFDQITSSDGKTTYQMKDLKPGTHVKIDYNSAFNAKYANKITILHP